MIANAHKIPKFKKGDIVFCCNTDFNSNSRSKAVIIEPLQESEVIDRLGHYERMYIVKYIESRTHIAYWSEKYLTGITSLDKVLK